MRQMYKLWKSIANKQEGGLLPVRTVRYVEKFTYRMPVMAHDRCSIQRQASPKDKIKIKKYLELP